jgi:hypothetical protein
MMAITLTVQMTDSATFDPVKSPLTATARLATPGLAGIVANTSIDRPLLQSYLMLMVATLADDYERQAKP